MNTPYRASLYSGDKVIVQKYSDDIEQLYVWMLTQANGNSGSIHGEIIDTRTFEVLKQFKKAPIE